MCHIFAHEGSQVKSQLANDVACLVFVCLFVCCRHFVRVLRCCTRQTSEIQMEELFAEVVILYLCFEDGLANIFASTMQDVKKIKDSVSTNKRDLGAVWKKVKKMKGQVVVPKYDLQRLQHGPGQGGRIRRSLRRGE